MVWASVLTALLSAGWVAYQHQWPAVPVPPPKAEAPIVLVRTQFAELPDWKTTDPVQSLHAFQRSCRTWLRQNPQQPAGSSAVPMRVQDWLPSCRAAQALHTASPARARAFFERWFTPAYFSQNAALTGLFTGYYIPQFSGSLVRTDTYNVPLYTLPRNRVIVSLRAFDPLLPNRTLVGRLEGNRVVPYYTRAELNQQPPEAVAAVLVWVKSPVDRLFLEIQGSGQVVLPSGQVMHLAYAGGNGASYVPIGRVLVQQGLLPANQVSMQRIRAYLEAHPEQMESIINQNPSVVFFTVSNTAAALGTQGVPLTPGYSLAVDRAWVPMGMPVWLRTSRPDAVTEATHPFARLMLAQDTGGAIKGPVRGDVFWGEGAEATQIAGKMQHTGRYWLLLPKTITLPST